jgi:hypothetical protein
MSHGNLTVGQITARLEYEKRRNRATCRTGDMVESDRLRWWPCALDPGFLSITEARQGTQAHTECAIDQCRVHRRARDVLPDQDAIITDSRHGP